jgi:hypothetical protein
MKPGKSPAARRSPLAPASSAACAPCPYAEAHAQGVVLRVRVQPRAGRTGIEGLLGNELKIRVAAPPVDDAANEALQRFLADRLECPRGNVQILRGHKSRSKVLLLGGVNLTTVTAALAAP